MITKWTKNHSACSANIRRRRPHTFHTFTVTCGSEDAEHIVQNQNYVVSYRGDIFPVQCRNIDFFFQFPFQRLYTKINLHFPSNSEKWEIINSCFSLSSFSTLHFCFLIRPILFLFYLFFLIMWVPYATINLLISKEIFNELY